MSKRSKNPLENLILALPDKKVKKQLWSLEEDAMLLKYGEEKGIANVAEAMGKSRNSAYDRFNFLKKSLK